MKTSLKTDVTPSIKNIVNFFICSLHTSCNSQALSRAASPRSHVAVLLLDQQGPNNSVRNWQ